MRGDDRGFSILETLVAIGVFAFVGVALYQSFTGLTVAAQATRAQIASTSILMEQVEIVRNLSYANVGEVGGIPNGTLPPTQTITRSGQVFTVTTTVRNVDDATDGTIGGSPNDLSPADYKRVEVEVSCSNCKYGKPVSFTTTQAPKALETSSTNGALFVQVLDANGQPVADANVQISNPAASPAISIDDVTGADGWLKIIDAPPGVNAYAISATKSGHSTDRTYPPGAGGNPSPNKPDSTVVIQQVTQQTLTIDDLGSLVVSSINEACAASASVPFTLKGSKTIGSPDVRKYDTTTTTNGSGTLSLPTMEWDTYTAAVTSTTKRLAGSIPLMPFALLPGAAQTLQLVMAADDPNALLVTVRDAATGLPVPDALVTITRSGVSTDLYTGRGFLGQTEWVGGAGQDAFTDVTEYFDADATIDTSTTPGEVRLANAFGSYSSSGTLTSSTFDTGSASTFHDLTWEPTSQPPLTGADPVRMQVAANNDATTWNFVGPDGTSGSYFTTSSHAIPASLDGNRYLRYKLFLSTDDTQWTPNVADVAFTFTSTCVPPGQVFFPGLTSGSYDITVTKAGYQDSTATGVPATSAWQEYAITLTPS